MATLGDMPSWLLTFLTKQLIVFLDPPGDAPTPTLISARIPTGYCDRKQSGERVTLCGYNPRPRNTWAEIPDLRQPQTVTQTITR